ncbi:30S ribosomal protein S17 [candidate division WOR-3 bacterium]|nr:30S ribosomal protein S17 [candidate division WOR-3 bacterium]
MDNARINRKKIREGIVVSDKMDKSIVVKVERKFAHPLYKKIVKKYKKFIAHDENNSAQEGDFVVIMETRPLSKNKCWTLSKILRKAKGEQGDI